MSKKPKIELRYEAEEWKDGGLKGYVHVEADGEFNQSCEMARALTVALCDLVSRMAQDVIVREHGHEYKKGADAFAVHLVMEGVKDFIHKCGIDPEELFETLMSVQQKEMEERDEELSALN